VLEFSGQEDSDQDLEHTSLNCNDGDDTENSVGCGPSLEVPEQLEEGNHTNDGREMSHSCHGGTKGVGVRVELDISTCP
jgi:hypothetical protein